MYALVLSAAIISMMLTPFVSGLTGPLYALRKRWFRHEPLQTINIPASGLRDHVVIAGAGRVGWHVAQVLRRLQLPFVLIELDYYRFEEAKRAGLPVVYGDASQRIVLEAARMAEARLLMITIPAILLAQEIVLQAQQLNQALEILARAEGVEQMKALYEKGVDRVIQPELEASLEMTRQVLLHLNLPATEVLQYSDAVCRDLCAPLPENDESLLSTALLLGAGRSLELNWLTLDRDSSFNGRAIGELTIRTRTGASVVGVMRDSTLHPNPGPEFRFEQGDQVAVIGKYKQFHALQELSANG